jgi:hypothetical protein
MEVEKNNKSRWQREKLYNSKLKIGTSTVYSVETKTFNVTVHNFEEIIL